MTPSLCNVCISELDFIRETYRNLTLNSLDISPVVVRGPPPGLVPVLRAAAGAGPGAPVPARRVLHQAFLQGAPQTVSWLLPNHFRVGHALLIVF